MKKKILVVDDDEEILNVVKHLLLTGGFDVCTHSTDGNVSDLVLQNHPNLILLDIHFFGKFGTQICKQLKEKYTIPIILFSADSDRGHEFAKFNADAYIEKPFDIKQLVDTINLHLN